MKEQKNYHQTLNAEKLTQHNSTQLPAQLYYTFD